MNNVKNNNITNIIIVYPLSPSHVEKWLVTVHTSKTLRSVINKQVVDILQLWLIIVHSRRLLILKKMLELKFTPDLNWNPIPTFQCLKLKSVYRSLVSDELFSTLKTLSYRRNVNISITFLQKKCQYFHGKCLEEIHLLVLPVQTFTARIRHVTFTGSNHTHCIRIEFVRNKFHTDSFLLRIATLLNRLPRGCFSDPYNLNHFKSTFNCYSSLISSSAKLASTIKHI